METIALFGGSFDPPHIGHEMIVKEALKNLKIDKVVVMPTFLNPFKLSSHISAKLRLQRLKELFKPYKNVEVSSFEVDLKRSVTSIESVHYLLKKYAKIYLIIGADNLATLHTWTKYNELKSLVTFVIATRNSIKIPDGYLTLQINEDISSTQIRKTIEH
ncbi:MAG: nicotinate (nicotinamide) nucleotide adenylyltransferase [Sulfurimonas sp.]|nr:nicotinate (nicotinamide) nucleotide adenylyltransferase [Sulfurimonas sp.]MDQ7059747.1 nicotinate (nicotinamide) nucleotide adenylyltransferase [Sulfurimonas sp.]